MPTTIPPRAPTDRDLCPSCAARRMVDVSAHMVDQVLSRVQCR